MCTITLPFIFRFVSLKNAFKPSFVITLSKAVTNFSQKRCLTSVSCDNMATDSQKIFHGKLDRFEGVTVLSTKEECPDSEFQQKLEGMCCMFELPFKSKQFYRFPEALENSW